MAAIQPIITPAWVVGLFMTVGVLFVPLGTWLKLEYAKVVEMEQRYDGNGKTVNCSISQHNEGKQCKVTFNVVEDMASPIYVYYELRKFYQNHRSYVKSRSFDQLEGGVSSADSCSPLKTADSLDLNPCGLAANSLFNDVIIVDSATDTNGPLSPPISHMVESGISWVTDRDGDFAQPNDFVMEECATYTSCDDCFKNDSYGDCENYTDIRTGMSYKYWYPADTSTRYLYEVYPEVISPVHGVEEERFIVWMRTAALPTFRKLYGRIEHNLAAPTNVTFSITANFHVTDFGGTKSLILTTLSPVGNRNGVLGGAFMAVGGACLSAALVVLSKFQRNPRDLADTSVVD